MFENGHRALAASVVTLAVEDLDKFYSKVRHWAEMDACGGLRGHVYKEMERQEAKKIKDYTSVTITADDLSAVKLFDEKSVTGDMFCSILDIDIEALPREVAKQRDYVRENAPRLFTKLQAFRSQWRRKRADAEGLVN